MKADKAIRLLKTVDPLSIGFRSSGAPYIISATGYNNGWTLNTSAQPGPGDLDTIVCTWEDTIDIAGLAANDISLINQGGAVARCISPIYPSQQAATMAQMTIVSVNPIEVDYLDYFTANSLAAEGNLQDYFMATTQEFNKSSQDSYILGKIGEHNFGTGGIAQATKLYVKSIVIGTVLNPAVVAPAPPITYQASMQVPAVTIAIGAITADLDPVQMAAAIYRANDQE
jgi:hypothetical protein